MFNCHVKIKIIKEIKIVVKENNIFIMEFNKIKIFNFTFLILKLIIIFIIAKNIIKMSFDKMTLKINFVV